MALVKRQDRRSSAGGTIPKIEFAPGSFQKTEARIGASPSMTFQDIGTHLEQKRQEKLLPEQPTKTEFDLINDLDETIEGIDALLGMYNSAGGFDQMGVMDVRSRNIPIISEWARQRTGKNRERFNQFYAKGEEVFAKLRKNITGAQASFQELQALRPIVPKVSDDPSIFLAKALATRSAADKARARRLQRLEQVGRNVSDLQGGEQKFELSPDEVKVEFFKALTKYSGMDKNRAAELVNDTLRNFKPEVRQTIPIRRSNGFN